MRTAVLFLVFNRPDTTTRVFQAIRSAQPPRLYVAADGPRQGRAGEADRCAEVRRIASDVDWPCEVFTLFRDSNFGCKRAVSSAISWFFQHETEGIILEDDCLPDPSFFPYCETLLQRYRDDPRIACISGDNFISTVWRPQSSYYFSRYMHIWGWATWRRAWAGYDVDMKAWKDGTGAPLIDQLFAHEPRDAEFWKSHFTQVADGLIDTWDYQWVFACWRQGGLGCMPASNLISNIGFGADATHTRSPESKHANLGVEPMPMPLRHPQAVEASLEADRWTSEHVFGVPPARRQVSTLLRGLKRRLQRTWVSGQG